MAQPVEHHGVSWRREAVRMALTGDRTGPGWGKGRQPIFGPGSEQKPVFMNMFNFSLDRVRVIADT
jgi:hypothetical protein